MHIHVVEAGPVATNAYVIHEPANDAALIVDAPMDSIDDIAEILRVAELKPKALILTHTHWDHTADAARMKQRWPDLVVYVHAADEYRLTDPMAHTVWPLPFTLQPLSADKYLADGDVVNVGGMEFRVAHTPGHTEGGVCLYFPSSGNVFVGDSLFAGSVGRTDLPGGDWDTLLSSIQNQLLTLPDETRVYPGHGFATSIGDERVSNPFLAP